MHHSINESTNGCMNRIITPPADNSKNHQVADWPRNQPADLEIDNVVNEGTEKPTHRRYCFQNLQCGWVARRHRAQRGVAAGGGDGGRPVDGCGDRRVTGLSAAGCGWRCGGPKSRVFPASRFSRLILSRVAARPARDRINLE